MKITKGLYVLLIGLVIFNVIILLLGIPTYIFGFEKNMVNNLLFVGMDLGFILFSIIIYFCVRLFKKTYFIMEDNEIIFYKKKIKQYSVQLKEIKNAEYLCFSLGTILNQSTFGYLKVSIDNRDIVIDMSKKTAVKIDEKYFKIKFIK